MKYYIGIDGGASKTRGLLADENGDILADYTEIGSNYQIVGTDIARHILENLITKLIETAKISLCDITFVEFALAGADLEEDFKALQDMVLSFLKDIPFEVVNDAWGLQRSGLKQAWGGVSIYGTGSNAGVVNPQGERYILRALTYPLGGGGGGHEMSLEALHYMFRADEQTYKPTLLTKRLPELLGFESPTHMIPSLYPTENLTRTQLNLIPPLVFELANEYDQVCIEILERHGRTHGQMICGVIRQSSTQDTAIPIVLGGSVYKGSNPTFINALKEEVLKVSPLATFIQSHYPPVAGALFLAFEKTGIILDPHYYSNFDAYFNM